MQSGVPPLLAMDATTKEKISPSFFCSTCGTPLSGMEDSDVYCTSCPADIPAPANAQASSSSGPPTKEPIFKFLCQQCDQKFSSPVGLAGRPFTCPVCSTENTVPLEQPGKPSRDPSLRTTVQPTLLPLTQEQFFPEFALGQDIANSSSGLSEQLLLLDDAGNTLETLPQREANMDTIPYHLDSCHSPRQLSCTQSQKLNKSSPGNTSVGDVEPENDQPIRITHPIHGNNRTILPQPRARVKSGELTPIRLGEETSALPAPNVKQPDPARKAPCLPPDSDWQSDSGGHFFSDEIEITKIFPVTTTQV